MNNHYYYSLVALKSNAHFKNHYKYSTTDSILDHNTASALFVTNKVRWGETHVALCKVNFFDWKNSK